MVRVRGLPQVPLWAPVCGLVLGWAVLVVLRHSWAGDMRLHLGTLHGLLRDPWKPVDPLVGEVEGSPYYSPYAVVLAAFAWLTGLRPQAVLELAGLANIALWLWALIRFCRGLGGPATGALAVVFSLLLWGLRPHEWSGFFGLYSLSWTMAYPSLTATALMLLAWREYLEARWAPLAPLLALILLIHPFTALNTVLGLLAFALARPSRLRDRWQYAAGAAAIVLALAWPWSDLAALPGATGGLSSIHRGLVLDLGGDFGLGHYGLALVGLPALVTGVDRRPLGRELMLLFVLAASVVGLGAVFGSYGFVRALPVALLPLHLALASYLGTAGWSARKACYAGVAAVACAAGLYGNSGGLIRAWWGPVSPQTLQAWKARDPGTVYAPLVRKVRPGMVVLGDRTWPGRLINGKGAYSVVPAWPYPFVDEAARRRDMRLFFARGTTDAERKAIIERYRVDCLMMTGRNRVHLDGFRVRARAAKGRVLLSCRLFLPRCLRNPRGRERLRSCWSPLRWGSAPTPACSARPTRCPKAGEAGRWKPIPAPC
ncbi:hypothetical protein [Actinocorallia aurantiaca]|uniref:Uncharacterized protein n=1 Tax=Actinocorallia aurantiaca TaxID=46204 RepID=A0ABP6H121_9ACTN